MIERYLSEEMKDLFSDKSRFEAYLKVEIAALRGWEQIGVIGKESVDRIEKNARVDVSRIREIEAITKHDVVAFTRQISETLGEEKRYVHYGLTSTDVVDTAMSLLYQKADDILLASMQDLKDALKEKALKYKYLPCIGRTHGMHAEVTSFGLKFLNFYDEVSRGIEDFQVQRKNLEVCKLSGAVGNYADIDPRVQEYAASYLHLESIPIATQVISRDRHERYGACLAIFASTLEKIAVEIRNLSRTEIHEVEEGFSKGQKGSSAMPQKRNPISSENVTGLARIIRGDLLPLLEDNALYHERDISHSSVERVSLIDMIELSHYAIKRMTSILKNLVVFEENIQKNINLSQGAIFAPALLKALIQKGLSREEAYDLIQPHAMSAALNKGEFKSLVESDEKIQKLLGKEELQNCFSFQENLKNVDYLYQRFHL